MGSCIRRRSSAFTSFNFVCNLLRIVCRSTVYIPLLLFFTQICVKPRKLNVSGFPSPRRCRLLIANGPNSSSRVRSEEHTSELQSQSNLVCRLLLEKKKTHS